MTDGGYWSRGMRQALSRRRLLRGTAAAGAGLLGAALVGCGETDDGDETATVAPGGGGAATATPTEAASSGPRMGGTYKQYIALDPTSLDPYGNLSYTTKGFAGYVYSRLYRIDAQEGMNPYGQLPIPDTAEGAETVDGTEWTVKLKPGVLFHDIPPVSGREMTTEDVMFSWERLTAPESPSVDLVPKDMRMEAVDDYTLKITLDAPSPTVLELLADANVLWLMPKESDGEYDPIATPIGSGPWVLEDYEASARMVFKKHPSYHIEGIPYMDGIENAIIPEYANAMAQFEAGNLHHIATRSTDVLDLKERRADVQWVGDITAGLYFLFFSPEDMDPDAPWRDERWRQAVSMAIDRDSLHDLQYNDTELSSAGLEIFTDWNNILPAGHGPRFWLDPKSDAQGPSSKFWQYDPEEARALVSAVPNWDQPFTYQYTGNGYGTVWVQYPEATHGWLQEIGLQPQTETQDYSSQYITQTFRGNFHGVTFGIQTPFPEAGSWIERMFGDDPANHGRIKDPTITELHHRQRVEMDPETRTQLFYDIQVAHGEKMYYVPTSGGSGFSWTAYQPEVRAFRRTRGYGGATEVLAYRWLDT